MSRYQPGCLNIGTRLYPSLSLRGAGILLVTALKQWYRLCFFKRDSSLLQTRRPRAVVGEHWYKKPFPPAITENWGDLLNVTPTDMRSDEGFAKRMLIAYYWETWLSFPIVRQDICGLVCPHLNVVCFTEWLMPPKPSPQVPVHPRKLWKK